MFFTIKVPGFILKQVWEMLETYIKTACPDYANVLFPAHGMMIK